jgi:hypothetical protein
VSVEVWKSVFDTAAVILLFLTFLAGAGVLLTGNVINRRQETKLGKFSKDLTDAETALAKQQERAANAEANIAFAQAETERLRNENLKLAGRIATTGHRNLLILGKQSLLGEAAAQFSGQKFEIGVCRLFSSDMELWETRAVLEATLSRSGKWVALPDRDIGSCTAGIGVFVRSTAPERSKSAAHRLIGLLNEVLGKPMAGETEFSQVGGLETQPNPHKPDTWVLEPSEDDAILILVGTHP